MGGRSRELPIQNTPGWVPGEPDPPRTCSSGARPRYGELRRVGHGRDNDHALVERLSPSLLAALDHPTRSVSIRAQLRADLLHPSATSFAHGDPLPRTGRALIEFWDSAAWPHIGIAS